MRSDLRNRTEVPNHVGRVLSYSKQGIADKMIGRHREGVGRGHAVEHPARKIVFRAVTGAEIAAGPLRGRHRSARIRIEQRDASEMRADAYQDGVFGLDCGMSVARLGRL